MELPTLEQLRRLPYQRKLEIHEEGGERYFVYRLVDIPEVVGDGETKDEALARLRECFDDYMSWRLEEGLPIRLPARVLKDEERCPEQKWSSAAPLSCSSAGGRFRVIDGGREKPVADARAETQFVSCREPVAC